MIGTAYLVGGPLDGKVLPEVELEPVLSFSRLQPVKAYEDEEFPSGTIKLGGAVYKRWKSPIYATAVYHHVETVVT